MIIDVHTHIFPPEVRDNRSKYADRDRWFGLLYGNPKHKIATAEDLLTSMAKEGVNRSVICGFGWADHALCTYQNDYLLQMVKEHPRRFICFVSIQPLAGAQAAAEMERGVAGGACGIGELMPDGQGFEPEDMALIVEAALALRLSVLVHASEPVGHLYPGKGTTTPWFLYRLARRFPRLPLICAHWGGGLPFYHLMPEVAKNTRNVYYDTAASPYLYEPAVYRIGVSLLGSRRILFGSDFPDLSQGRALRDIRNAGLPPEALADLLGGNAARLLGLEEET